MMKRKQPIDKLYCERLATLARFDRENRGEIEFSEYAIFPYESSRGLRRVKADELVYNRSNPILKQLRFGTGIKDKEKELAAMKKFAEKEGLRLVSEDEYQEFMKWKKRNG